MLRANQGQLEEGIEAIVDLASGQATDSLLTSEENGNDLSNV